MDRIELHLIRSDGLLWTLGGFAEGDMEPTLRERIIAEAVKYDGRIPAQELAARLGTTPKSLSVQLHRARRQGYLAPPKTRGRRQLLAADDYAWIIELARLNLLPGGCISTAVKDRMARHLGKTNDAVGMILAKARHEGLLPPAQRGAPPKPRRWAAA